jgi:hypothetical protein
LQYIYDLKATISTLYRILKPGGVVLATIPGIAHISRYDLEHWGEYWRLTSLSAQKLFGEVFPPENVEVQAYGNLLTAAAFLYGLPAEGFKQEELDYQHPDFQVLITARAVSQRDSHYTSGQADWHGVKTDKHSLAQRRKKLLQLPS